MHTSLSIGSSARWPDVCGTERRLEDGQCARFEAIESICRDYGVPIASSLTGCAYPAARPSPPPIATRCAPSCTMPCGNSQAGGARCFWPLRRLWSLLIRWHTGRRVSARTGATNKYVFGTSRSEDRTKATITAGYCRTKATSSVRGAGNSHGTRRSIQFLTKVTCYAIFLKNRTQVSETILDKANG